MLILAIAIVEAILLGATAWSARRRPTRSYARFGHRADGLPHAL
jgi:hypothetical protein